MLPLLALLVAGGLLALGSGKGPGVGKLAPIRLKAPAAPKDRVKLTMVRIAAAPSLPLPTLAQILLDQEKQVLANAEEVQAIHVAQAHTHVPAHDADPGVFSDWGNSYNLTGEEFVKLTPFFGWWRNHDSHQETVWRAQYKLGGNRGAVEWWVNTDHTFNYHHVWGGFDLWKDIAELADDIEDAAKWLDDHLSHVDWKAIADDIETVASFVPVLGTAVSDIVATAEVVIEDLSNIPSLEKAVDTAYDYALASIPGGASLHDILDPIKDAIVKIALHGEKVGKVVIDDIASQAPDSPNIEGISPRSITTSLLTIVAHALGVST